MVWPAAEEKDVVAVLICMFGEVGLLRGADEEEEDNPRRARSTLKLDNRESGGMGDELFRFRDRKLVAKGSPARSSAGVRGCLWKTLGSMIARRPSFTVPCDDTMLRPGIVDPGADEYLLPPPLPSGFPFFPRKLPDLDIHEVGELKCIDKERRARLWGSSAEGSVDGRATSCGSSSSSSPSSMVRLSSS